MEGKRVMKKNANGAGTIRQKSKNLWEARFTLGKCPETGKQIQKSVTGKTQAEARAKMFERIRDYDKNGYTKETEISVAEWLEQWYTQYLKKQKPRTVDNYTHICNKHLIPRIGKYKLAKLTSEDLEKLANNLQKDLSSSTVLLIFTVLKMALTKAITKKKLNKNPFDSFDTDELPEHVRTEVKPLDEKGVSEFVKAIKGHRFENFFILALLTGARQGELLGITWDCIDFKQKSLRINKQLQRTGTLETTKNGKERILILPQQAIQALEKQRQHQLECQFKIGQVGSGWQNDLGLCFTDEIGRPETHAKVSKAYKKIVTAIGYPDSYFHCLRHTNCTMLLKGNKVDLVTISQNLGHHSTKFTTDRYGHTTTQSQAVAASHLDEQFQAVKMA